MYLKIMHPGDNVNLMLVPPSNAASGYLFLSTSDNGKFPESALISRRANRKLIKKNLLDNQSIVGASPL